MWGCNAHQSMLESPELCIFNDKTHTYLHPGTGTTPAIELNFIFSLNPHGFSLRNPQWSMWQRLLSNIPQIKEFYTRRNKSKMTNPQKVDWIKFDNLCSTRIDEGIFNKPDPMSAFTNTQIKIAKQTIPKPHTKTNSWFTVEYREAVKSKKKILKLLNPNPTNFQKYQQAKARYTIKKAK